MKYDENSLCQNYPDRKLQNLTLELFNFFFNSIFMCFSHDRYFCRNKVFPVKIEKFFYQIFFFESRKPTIYLQQKFILDNHDQYSILQYVNQCWESESEWNHKWEKREFMLAYAFRQIFMNSTRQTDKIIKNYCYVPRNWIRIFNLIGKLLKTTVSMYMYVCAELCLNLCFK
jgi:hypothetical protein